MAMPCVVGATVYRNNIREGISSVTISCFWRHQRSYMISDNIREGILFLTTSEKVSCFWQHQRRHIIPDRFQIDFWVLCLVLARAPWKDTVSRHRSRVRLTVLSYLFPSTVTCDTAWHLPPPHNHVRRFLACFSFLQLWHRCVSLSFRFDTVMSLFPYCHLLCHWQANPFHCYFLLCRAPLSLLQLLTVLPCPSLLAVNSCTATIRAFSLRFWWWFVLLSLTHACSSLMLATYFNLV